MKLLIDMNLSPRWIEWLRDKGQEAEHWRSIGSATAPDSVLMDHALATRSVVLTSDLDFGAMLASSRNTGPSVVLLRADVLTPEHIGEALMQCLTRFAKEIEAGAIAVLDGRRQKIRLLPIRAPMSP